MQWYAKACELWRSANLLWDVDNSGANPQAAMLAAMSLECWFKGICLRNGEELEKLMNIGGGHDLSQLADRAGLTVTGMPRKMLTSLSVFITVSGRYPTEKEPKNGKFYSGYMLMGKDFADLWAMYDCQIQQGIGAESAHHLKKERKWPGPVPENEVQSQVL